MLSPPSTRASGSRGRRSSAFVREDSGRRAGPRSSGQLYDASDRLVASVGAAAKTAGGATGPVKPAGGLTSAEIAITGRRQTVKGAGGADLRMQHPAQLIRDPRRPGQHRLP